MSASADHAVVLAELVVATGRDDSDAFPRVLWGTLGVLAAAASWMAFTGRWRSWVDDVRGTHIAISGPSYALMFVPYAIGTIDAPDRSPAYVLLGLVPPVLGALWWMACFVLVPVFHLARPRWMQPPWLRRGEVLPRDVLIAKARRRRGGPPDTEESPMEITAGQVWTYRTRPGEHASRARVLLVEDHPTLGPIVHVRLDDLLISNPHTEGRLATWLGHAPITRQAFEASVIAVVGTEDAAPDLEGVQIWRDDQGGVFTLTLAEIVSSIEVTLTGAET